MSKPISPEDAALDEILRNGERSDDEEEAELTPALPVPLPRIPAGPNRGRVHPSTPPPGAAPLPEPRLPSTRPGTAGIPVSAPPGAPVPAPAFDSHAAPQGVALPSADDHKDTLPGIAQVPPHVAAQVPAPLPAPGAELRSSSPSTLAGLPAMRSPERLPSKPPGLGLPATPPQVAAQARLPGVSPPERLPSRTPVPGLPATPPQGEQARLPSVSPPERLPSRPPVLGLPAAPPQVAARTSSPPAQKPLPAVVPPAAKTPLPSASKRHLEPLAAEPDTLRQDKATLSAIHDRPSTELARRAWSEPPPRIPSTPPQKASLAQLAAEVQQATAPAETVSKEASPPAPSPAPVRSARVRKIAWLSLLAFVGAGALVAAATLARGALQRKLSEQGALVPAAKLLSSIALPTLVSPPGSQSSSVAASASASAPLPEATATPPQQPVDISSLPAASTKPPAQQEPPATGESKHKTATATTKPPAASAHPTAKPSDKVPDFGGRE